MKSLVYVGRKVVWLLLIVHIGSPVAFAGGKMGKLLYDDSHELKCAVRDGNVSDVRRLAQEVEDINYRHPYTNGRNTDVWYQRNALDIAAAKNDVEIIKILVSNGADVNPSNVTICTPLHHACVRGNYEAVKALVGYGAAITAMSISGWSALHLACRGHNSRHCASTVCDGTHLRYQKEIVRFLCEKIFETSSEHRGVLEEANNSFQSESENGEREVQFHFDSDESCFDIRSKKKNETPLHVAAQDGLLEIVQILVEFGANPRLTSDEDKTPCDLAAEEGHDEVVGYLSQFTEENILERI